MSDNQPQMRHSDSIDSQDPNSKKKGDKEKSRRPANTAFRQQRLKAWQPILTPKTVIPLFFVIGIIFAPLGGGLLYASAQVNEFTVDYSTCADAAPAFPEFSPIPTSKTKWFFKDEDKTIGEKASWSKQEDFVVDFQKNVQYTTTQCTLEFTIPSQMNAPVLFYYRLTNFYQNHRRYVKSFQASQLKGNAVDNKTIQASLCAPLLHNTTTGLPYYPCGLIANSLFNDTFSSPVLLNTNDGNGTSNETYVMNNSSDIAWASDKSLYGKTSYNLSAIAPPPNWIKKWPNGYTEDNPPINPAEDEAFQVWMRTAGLPTFSKLAQRNDDQPMKPGTYRLQIDMNYNVTEFGGTKSIVLSTRTIMGGKNPFLGIAYVAVGGICIVLGVVFTVTNLVKPRKLGDHTYLSWNNEQPSTAISSGREIRPE